LRKELSLFPKLWRSYCLIDFDEHRFQEKRKAELFGEEIVFKKEK